MGIPKMVSILPHISEQKHILLIGPSDTGEPEESTKRDSLRDLHGVEH